MTRPSAEHLFEVLDATWPAARIFDQGPWRFREGRGGGQRVSAATSIAPVTKDDVSKAEKQMRDLGQCALFMVRNADDALDRVLAARHYDIVDPVVLYLSKTAELAKELPITSATPSWPPLAIQLELWDAGGIGPERIAVMERAPEPKMSFLGRTGDTPVGTAFAAIHDGIAMLHALEITPVARRRGVARRLMQAAANWALRHRADWITLAVTRANAAANALYRDLGMEEATQYHYRRKAEAAL